MQSNGGVQRWDAALKRPVGSINSGPAAAFPASLFYAEMLGCKDILSVDMGGTSFDVGLIKDRNINTTTDGWTGLQRNATPMVDILAIGAGGGSIAWIDPNGILRVGPKSAGSVPGPVCYGRGGEEPTVTDANLILGYLDPDYFLGGKMAIDVDAARKALKKIADQLGIGIIEVADAIYNVVNENMINAIALAAIRRGYDPQDFLLVVGGGTGATHAVSLAQKLKISRILIPKQSPVYCAFGLLLSDLKHDYVRSHIVQLRGADLNAINSLFEEMEAEGKRALQDEGVAPENIIFHRSADMRYLGQYKEVEIDFPKSQLEKKDIEFIENLFSERHKQLFTFSDPNRGLEILTLKVKAIGKVPRPSIKGRPLENKSPEQALKGCRKVYFTEEKDFLDTNIYDGDLLKPGNIIEGPAIVEEIAMTLVIPPKFKFKVDQYGNYISIL
jgi:N-methylhydantoinase A